MRLSATLRRPGALPLLIGLLALIVCGPGEEDSGRRVVVFPGSRVGDEGRALEEALARFGTQHPDIRVELRATPDSADERHQLYVGWLSAGDARPDVLQLDGIWVAEFARAGWILPLERFDPPVERFFAQAVEADRFEGSLFALPWFIDVGMLYWRTDLLDAPPARFEQLASVAREARDRAGLPYGLVWPGARYEGLVTVFLEYLTGFGGQILDEEGEVAVDSPEARRALEEMRRAIAEGGIVPREAMAWTEERARQAFQSGRAVLMRNWPYAYALLQDPARSAVAGNVAVAAMPAGPGGVPSAALGGQQLAINARSADPEAAWTLIEFLTSPAEMRARAALTGQFPARPALFEDGALELAVPPETARAIIERAVARPRVPVYSELSEILQIHLHRALEGGETAEEALRAAAHDMRALLARDATSSAG